MTKIYYNNLDGLRAFAAIGVMLFHANISYFWYGWAGIEIFFVISGFLITSILLDSKKTENYFSVFYMRRALRIFPIYYLVLFFTLFYCIIQNINIGEIYYCFFYIQNFPLSYHNWKDINIPSFLNHTWSLAVEEQFYLFFPAIVYFFNKKSLLYFCILMVFLSICMKIFLNYFIPNNPIIWANTISCLDFLLCGAILSIFHTKSNKHQISIFLFYISLIFTFFYVIFIYFIFRKIPFSFPFLLTKLDGILFWIWFLPITTYLIHFLVITKNKIIVMIFCNPLSSYLGKISYGIYLFHYPVFYFMNILFVKLGFSNGLKSIVFIVCSKILLTIIISILSWEFFEKRILLLKNKFNYK